MYWKQEMNLMGLALQVSSFIKRQNWNIHIYDLFPDGIDGAGVAGRSQKPKCEFTEWTSWSGAIVEM